MSATTNIMKHTTNELSGGYILLPTYDDSLPVDPADDETPVMYFAVSIKGIKTSSVAMTSPLRTG